MRHAVEQFFDQNNVLRLNCGNNLSSLAYPAYLSSMHQSSNLSNAILERFGLNILNNEFLSILDSLPSEYSSLDDNSKKIQKKWDLIGVQKSFDELLASCNPVDCARLLASSTKESSKWLQVISSTKLGLLLDNNAARIAAALRLGCQICEEHNCICGKLVNKDGRHGFTCKYSKDWTPRHNDINNIISHTHRLAFQTFCNHLAFRGLMVKHQTV